MLQAGITASTAGRINELSAKVPVTFDQVQKQKLRLDITEMIINAISHLVELGTISISAVLCDN
jgi:hypothetical protein